MGDTKWTPGSLAVVQSSWRDTCIVSEDGRTVALLSLDEDGGVNEENQHEFQARQRADADRLAAAPDLYEALSDLLDEMRAADRMNSEAAKRAEAALSKARGE